MINIKAVSKGDIRKHTFGGYTPKNLRNYSYLCYLCLNVILFSPRKTECPHVIPPSQLPFFLVVVAEIDLDLVSDTLLNE